MKKYYEAYEDRYKKVHQETGLAWAGEKPSQTILDLLEKYHADENSSILEVGCGEGQNAFNLLAHNYNNLEAFDVSKEAISWCKINAKKLGLSENHFFVADALKDKLNKKYDFIYSVAVLHMLVEDEDRNKFLRFFHEHLNDNGKGFIIIMGDGKETRKTDPTKAFELADRPFGDSTVQVATTSCRMVTWEQFLAELEKAGLKVVDKYLDYTISGFNVSMVAEVERVF